MVLTHYTSPKIIDVAQAYALGTVLLAQATNYLVVGPQTSKYATSYVSLCRTDSANRIMFKRQKLEKDEGKKYTDAGVSPEMQALTRQFGILHGVSSLANLGAVIALIFHGLLL